MANRKVSVWKYVKVGKRWKYCKPVMGGNHKIKPHWVLVNKKPEHHPEGNYYISYRQGRKKIWKKIGPSAPEADNAAYVERSLLNAKALGVPIKEETVPLEYGPQMWKFLADYKLSQSAESHALMSQTLDEFRVFAKKTDLRDITRADMLKYKQWLVNRDRSLRTAGNKMLRVNQFLRAALGQETGKGLVTVKDAKFTEREPEIYTDDELEVFLGTCSEFHSRVFHTLLMAGLRKQEMENLEWPDINFVTGVLSVRGKATFQPKDWEERDIEMPEELREMLFSARKDRGLVFCTKSKKKYTHVWDDCKDIAKKIALAEIKRREITDEDEIKQILEETGAKYHPHKFRATYCTKLLQSGIDLKTVQKLMGHKTIESTMRYLAKAQSHVVKAKVNAVQWKKARPSPVRAGAHSVPLETKLVWSEE